MWSGPEGFRLTDTLVVGDVHGNIDRLEALLKQEDVDNRDCQVVQLGDLGHFGGSRGSPTGDLIAWMEARDGLVDYVLWGNHDRAVVDPHHHFGGYERPDYEVKHIMRLMQAEGRLLMAMECHGWLLTHAGLHAQFKYQKTPKDVDKTSAASIADWINQRMRDDETEPVIDAIGGRRGGWSPFGGILWRDVSEKLYRGIPQIFGHSAHRQHIVRGEQDRWYCVDIGGKGGPHDQDAQCLAGIWLPSQEIVRVDKVGV